ncbi:uncharacterized protein LOC141525487 [Cotesia typhae]|uniref:uncharacterized protein LOC141525487 n=1 Tax=Cotesia typhae TaxID=2053667 RepID=UPI003D697D5B
MKVTLGLDDNYLLCSSCRKKASELVKQQTNARNDPSADVSDREDNYSDNNDNNDQADNDSNTTAMDLPLSLSFRSMSFDSEPKASQSSSGSQVSAATQLPVINHALELLNQSPIPSKKLNDNQFLNNKINRRRICETMNTSRHLSRVAKNLVEETGLLSTPESKLDMGRTITDQVKLKVENFYNDDEYSAQMPGMKDFVSIRSDDGNRIHVQKRLILSNLKELYQCFCEINPTERIGFSKFVSLRPKHCVLAGASGTHTICVCTIHQNVKLMMLGANIYSLTRNTEKPIKHYSDYLSMIICENPSFQCYLGGFKNCPGVDELSKILLKCFEDREIENITYKYWISKPRSSLETIIKPTEEFVEKFCSELEILLPHSFIAKEQAQFLKTLKETLKPNEYVIICDFAENYAFVVQNAAAGFHWNNNQATVFPDVIYYTVNNKLEHKSLVIISDFNKHDAVAVHVFIEIITDYVKSLPERCNKIYYFSDGAPQQFKNFKNFVNLYYHEDDFDIPAEWHFLRLPMGKVRVMESVVFSNDLQREQVSNSR